MLHLDIEVQTIQFFINSSLENCSMQFNDTFVSKILESKIKCRCKDPQEIYERIELNIQYTEKGNLKLIFFDGQTLLGEANISLGFYIENNLPLIIDNITITNKFDQEAQVQVSLAWNQIDQVAIKQTQNTQPIRQASPIREQPIPIPLPSKPAQPKKPGDEVHFEKRIIHATYAQWRDHQQMVRVGYEKKLQEPIKYKQYEDEKIEEIRKPEVKAMSPRRFQTPVINKPSTRQQIQKTEGRNDYLKAEQFEVKQNGRAPSKSPNRYDSRIKNRSDNQTPMSPIEQSEILKGSTKPKTAAKRGEFIDTFGARPTQVEPGLTLSSRQLDIQNYEQENGSLTSSIQSTQAENNKLKIQIQKLTSENQGLKDQLVKSEAAFNLLSETYTTLRNEYQKIQVKSFNNSSSHSLLNNKENDHLRREIDQKMKEVEFYKKEADLWKKDIDVTKRENVQLKRECEQFRKECEQFRKESEGKFIDNDALKREVENKRKEIETLERDLRRAQQAIELIQNDSLRSLGQFQGSGSNAEILDQMKNLIKTKQIEIDGKNEELRLNKVKITSLEREIYENSRKIQDQYDQIRFLNSQLELDNEKLRQQIQEKDLELQSKNQDVNRLQTQHNFLSSPDTQHEDFNRIMNEFQVQIATLKQENQTLSHSSKKDQVKLDTIQKELDITKRIVELSEQRQSSLESEISQLEKAVVNGKQNMADVINAVMECGGNQLAEEVERYLIIRRSTKVS